MRKIKSERICRIFHILLHSELTIYKNLFNQNFHQCRIIQARAIIKFLLCKQANLQNKPNYLIIQLMLTQIVSNGRKYLHLDRIPLSLRLSPLALTRLQEQQRQRPQELQHHHQQMAPRPAFVCRPQ